MRLNGKKAVYFVGPMHHQRIVYPVLERLEKEGLKVIYLTCNQEPPFERFCIDRGIPFRYEYEYLTPELEKEINENFIKIGKEFMKRYYSEYVSTYWPLSIMSKIVRWTVETYYIYRHILRKEKPDFVIYQNEMNMWSIILGHLAYNMGIPAISFHEGSYYHDFFTLRLHNSYSINLLWGEEISDVIVRNGANPLRCIHIGNTHLDAEIKKYDERALKKLKEQFGIREEFKTIFIIISLTDVPTNLIESINNLIEFLNDLGSFHIFIKHHPLAEALTVRNFASQIKEGRQKVVNLHEEEAYPYIAVSDLCITTGRSTLVMEALAFGKWVIDLSNILGYDSYYKEMLPTPKNYEELRIEIKKAFEGKIDESILAKQRFYIEKEFGVIDGAINRAADYIRKLLEVHQKYNTLIKNEVKNLHMYKEGDKIIISVVELESLEIEKLFSFKNLKEDCIYGLKSMGLIYDISSRPLLSDSKNPKAITGVVITNENILQKLGIVEYDEPLLSIIDFTNRAKNLGYKLELLDINIDLRYPIEERLYRIQSPYDAIKFYINNLIFVNKEV